MNTTKNELLKEKILLDLEIDKRLENIELNYNSIAINTLLRKSISTYYGSLNFDDYIYSDIEYELKDNSNGGYFRIDGYKDLIPINDIIIDFDYIDNPLNIFLDYFKDRINEYIPDLEKIFNRYGIYNINYSTRSPNYYNYNDDELSFKYQYDNKEINKDLIPYIKNYIENIRIRSYDGYCSFEPDRIENVDKGDYAFIYAILDKENLIENFKLAIDEAIDDCYQTYYENFTSYFHYNDKDYIMDCDDNGYYLKEKTN